MNKVLASPKHNKILPTKLSSSALLTLYVLHVFKSNDNKPIYGNEILQKINDQLGGAWSPSHGTLYPLLNELEQQGYLRVIANDNKRKFYIMTSDGYKMLREKLIELKDAIVSSKLFFDNLTLSFYGNEVTN